MLHTYDTNTLLTINTKSIRYSADTGDDIPVVRVVTKTETHKHLTVEPSNWMDGMNELHVTKICKIKLFQEDEAPN